MNLLESVLSKPKVIKWFFIGLAVFIAVSLFFSKVISIARIDAGHVGIKVNKYGDEKGVDAVAKTTGTVIYFPYKTAIYEFPTFVQTVSFEANDGILVTTKNSMVVGFDVSVNYRVMEESAVAVFTKYRKPVDELSRTIIRNYVKDGFNTTAGAYNAQQLYENRVEYMQESEKAIKVALEQEGFFVENVVLTSNLRLPKAVTAAVDRKVEAEQIAQQKQNELLQVQADAEKQIAAAKGQAESARLKASGDADALLIKAESEAKANKLVTQSITPQLIEYVKVNRWNGVQPQVVGNDGGVLLNLSPQK